MEGNTVSWKEFSDATKLDIGNKQLTTLNGISTCKNLTWLNVSGNSLDTLHWLKKLKKLNVLKASNNNIINVKHLSTLSDLKALILNNNKLSSVEGIEGLLSLNALVLSHNQVEEIDVSTLVHLSKLSLSHNKLKEVPDLQHNVDLKEVRLNDNIIKNIPSSLEKCKRLKLVDFGNNKISNFKFLDVLSKLQVENLNLKGNEVCSNQDYRTKVIEALTSLRILDGRRIEDTSVARDQTENSSKEITNLSTEPHSLKSELPLEMETEKKQSSLDKKITKTGGFVSKFSTQQNPLEATEHVQKKKKDSHGLDQQMPKKKVTRADKISENSVAEVDGKISKKRKKNDKNTLKSQSDQTEADEKESACQTEAAAIKLRDQNGRKRKVDNDDTGSTELKKTKKVKKRKTKLPSEQDRKSDEKSEPLSEVISKSSVDRKSRKLKKDDVKKLQSEAIKKMKKQQKGTKRDSRSGVVAVELVDSKNRNKTKSRDDVLAVTTEQQYAFGTGESTSW